VPGFAAAWRVSSSFDGLLSRDQAGALPAFAARVRAGSAILEIVAVEVALSCRCTAVFRALRHHSPTDPH
jgi:hypothetical protein